MQVCSVIINVLMADVACVYRFRKATKDSEGKFFLRYSSGKPLRNVTREVDCLQREYSLPTSATPMRVMS